jgi:hypothetical protein
MEQGGVLPCDCAFFRSSIRQCSTPRLDRRLGDLGLVEDDGSGGASISAFRDRFSGLVDVAHPLRQGEIYSFSPCGRQAGLGLAVGH